MNKRVLLIFERTPSKNISINLLPPLGILSIAAFLESKGVACDVLDLSIESHSKYNPDNYDVIGFSVNISNRISTVKAIKALRLSHRDKDIVVGGSLCISNPELFFDDGMVDAIFVGEGEEALFEYVIADDKSMVKGIYLKHGNGYIFTGERGWVENLDNLPFPALDKVDITKYNAFPKKRKPISSIMTSRGCPFDCIFCSHSMGKRWRFRSADNVVEEIVWQVEELGVRELCVFDDNFSLNKKRAVSICERLMERGIEVSLQFTNGLRADCLDDEVLDRLKRAGTWLIGLAPETGTAEIMKKIKKGFNHAQVDRARELCRNHGIKTFGFFMMGFPFETRNDILKTLKYAVSLDCEIVEFNRVIPHSKTELYEMMKLDGTLLNEPYNMESYHDGSIKTHDVGELSQKDVDNLLKRAYRRYYLRPKKMIDLIQTFSIRDLLTLTAYAFRTGNV